MLTSILQNIFKEIEKGIDHSRHPFKFGCLSSIENNSPQQRMVVIRKLKNNQLTIYTDKRSPKVSQFATNSNTSLLFYDTIQMTQIILKGMVTIVEDENSKIWKSIPDFSHKDYTSLLAPGTPIDHAEPEYKTNTPHFCYLHFNFTHIDYLKINKPHNIRAHFNLNKKNNWEGSYVVP